MSLIPRPRIGDVRNGDRCDSKTRESITIDAATGHAQGYILRIDAAGVAIIADDPAGAFYARQTLTQLLREYPGGIPAMTIEDYPDFPVRGFMLDISRDKVPTMATLFELVDLLASLKINQFQLYTEHTFAYREHEIVWKDASPMTAEEIRQLGRYCKDRFIELVPNQQSFGHLERWFEHEPYRKLAEKPDGFTFVTGKHMPHGFSLNPTDPACLKFIESRYDELLPNFSSGLLNVGCDETFDLGLGRSKSLVEKLGRERVYLDFMLKIYHAVKSRGRTMMFWGDIILERPELLKDLPRDLVALNWGYEAKHPFERETAAFREAGVPFYVCPGTSSWCSISGRTDNAIANLKFAAVHGLANGAIGYLITDWGDYGHLQYLPVSYLGLAAGAAYSWCYEANKDIDLSGALDRHIFKDSAGVMGRLMHDFGNVYQCADESLANGSRFFWALLNDPERRSLFEKLTADEFERARKAIDQSIARLDDARMDRADSALIVDEIRNAAAMLRLACGMGDRAAIVAEHRRLWLARNRDGGLDHSVAQLLRTGRDSSYASAIPG